MTLVSASFPNGLPELRSEAEARAARPISIVDAIAPGRTRYAGISDDQLANEHEARSTLMRAIDAMHDAIAKVNYTSALVTIDPVTFDNFVHDELSFDWEEKIARARSK